MKPIHGGLRLGRTEVARVFHYVTEFAQHRLLQEKEEAWAGGFQMTASRECPSRRDSEGTDSHRRHRGEGENRRRSEVWHVTISSEEG